MVNVNILYDTTNGRILSSKLNAISPVPVGFAVTVKDIGGVEDVFDKRINPTTLALVDKDFLSYESDTEITFGSVATAVFVKKDGETKELKDDASDNETVSLATREMNLSHSSLERAFFDTNSVDLVNGAGQVKVAAGLATGSETLVFFNDTLKPAFQLVNYV